MLTQIQGSIAEIRSRMVRNFTRDTSSNQSAVARLQKQAGTVGFRSIRDQW